MATAYIKDLVTQQFDKVRRPTTLANKESKRSP
jgi:hypothetical protein